MDDQSSGLKIQVDTFARNFSMRLKPNRVGKFIQTLQDGRGQKTDYF
jgi:hypothetical protein